MVATFQRAATVGSSHLQVASAEKRTVRTVQVRGVEVRGRDSRDLCIGSKNGFSVTGSGFRIVRSISYCETWDSEYVLSETHEPDAGFTFAIV